MDRPTDVWMDRRTLTAELAGHKQKMLSRRRPAAHTTRVAGRRRQDRKKKTMLSAVSRTYHTAVTREVSLVAEAGLSRSSLQSVVAACDGVEVVVKWLMVSRCCGAGRARIELECPGGFVVVVAVSVVVDLFCVLFERRRVFRRAEVGETLFVSVREDCAVRSGRDSKQCPYRGGGSVQQQRNMLFSRRSELSDKVAGNVYLQR